MKSVIRIALSLSILTSVLSMVSLPSAVAVSSNPTPDCSAVSTCTITFSYTGDIYNWTTPAGITSLTITAKGGGGGDSVGYASDPGNGAVITATVPITTNTTLKIMVGGQGQTQRFSAGGGGGGGGSFVATSANTPLLIAGGAGGAGGRNGQNGLNGSLNTTGTKDSSAANTAGTSGSGGFGGQTSYGGGGGGGLTGNGGSGTESANGGFSFTNGGAGGVNNTSSYAANGAYGGGGASGFAGGGGGGYSGGAGGYGGEPYSGGGGGGSFIATGATNISTSTGLYDGASTFNSASITNTGGYNAGAGQVTITYLNAPAPISFTTVQSVFTNTTSAITYSISFSQNVNSVADADFSNAGTATGCVFSISASSGTNFTLTISSCSEGTLRPQVLANSVFGTITSTNGPAANTSTTTPITIDRTGPTVASVNAPANKTYIPSETPTFTVNFSESVTVTGTPRLNLTVGIATTKFAYFVSMSDSKTALFRYTVGTTANEYDTDGITMIGAIDQISGSVSDLAGNALTNSIFTPPTLTSVLVAQPASAPTISSITATTTQLSVAFTAGAANGSTTTSYQYSTNNGSSWNNRASGTTASPLVITGLIDGTGYTVRLRAVTNAGNSDSSTAVTETPTAVVVTGDTTLVLTYGNSASTGSYSATGGTGSYTWSLGSSLTGISLSGTTVTASSSTPAGTYTQTVRATDTNSQVGSKTLTITVNKASTSITIALPGSATNAALGGAVTITATVPRAGAVNFMLGGTTISGCGSASAASTTATCSWTPNALGSVALTATFTPTDSSNFETSTTTTLSITVVNGVSTVTLSLAGGTVTPPKGQTINIIAAVDQAGRITFLIDGKRIPGCNNRVANVGNVTCSWKPAIQKETLITARLVPTNNVYNPSTSSLNVRVVRRSGTR